jgi:hypothetical protein
LSSEQWNRPSINEKAAGISSVQNCPSRGGTPVVQKSGTAPRTKSAALLVVAGKLAAFNINGTPWSRGQASAATFWGSLSLPRAVAMQLAAQARMSEVAGRLDAWPE